MKEILIIYVITQLITTAYGLAVIESIRPFVEKELREKGYHRNSNSLYNFNNTFSNVLKGFIPFYYFSKALRVVTHKNTAIEENVNEKIEKGTFVKEDEIKEEPKEEVTVIDEPVVEQSIANVAFEKPEKYKARKNNVSLYDIYETPIDYETHENTKEDKLEINPFINDEKVIEQVVVKEPVTNKEIAKAICNLSEEELYMLAKKIKKLETIKRNTKSLKLEKDVA